MKPKVVAIAAVTAGGKTTLVNEIKKRLPNVLSLHFDDYSFDGEVEDFAKWVEDGADYSVWNLSPMVEDVRRIKQSADCEYLLLDYPFAYLQEQMRGYIDCAVFIDTPLDVSLARRILRDMKNADGAEIRCEMEMYLSRARAAYLQMLKDVLPTSDYVIDGAKELNEKVGEMIGIMASL